MLYRRCNEMHRNSRPVLGHPSPLIARFEMAYRGSARSVVNLLVAKGACLLFYFKNLGHSRLSETGDLWWRSTHRQIVLFYLTLDGAFAREISRRR